MTVSDKPAVPIHTVGLIGCERALRAARWPGVSAEDHQRDLTKCWHEIFLNISFYAMKRTKTSKTWMKEHVNDFFVKQARKEGYRSRAAYKLIEIAERDHLLGPGMTIVDLGAAPGGWSQVAAEKLGGKGRIIALDLLEMPAIPGVTFMQGDFREPLVLAELKKNLRNRSS